MMHLMSHAYTTTSTKKRKSKGVTITAKYAKDFREYNKLMRKNGIQEKTLEEYIAYRQGKSKPALRGVGMPNYKVSDHRSKYPSYGDQIGSVAAKAEKKYTGTLIKGISTLHKSNAVPVINDEQILEIAKMRRG